MLPQPDSHKLEKEEGLLLHTSFNIAFVRGTEECQVSLERTEDTNVSVREYCGGSFRFKSSSSLRCGRFQNEEENRSRLRDSFISAKNDDTSESTEEEIQTATERMMNALVSSYRRLQEGREVGNSIWLSTKLTKLAWGYCYELYRERAQDRKSPTTRKEFLLQNQTSYIKSSRCNKPLLSAGYLDDKAVRCVA
jgi:hypothetical protein